MRYQWVCNQTNRVVEVSRSIEDRDLPPEEEGEWERIYTAPAFIGPKNKGNW